MEKSVRNVEKALGEVTFELSEKVEKNKKFARSLFAVKDIKEGDVITEENVRSVRPGYGLHPKSLKNIIGKKSSADISKGTPIKAHFIN